jgi:hypothetical protein
MRWAVLIVALLLIAAPSRADEGGLFGWLKPADDKAEAPKAPNASAKPKAAPAKVAVAAREPAKPQSDPVTALPPDERIKIQSALLWSGDYTGAAAGEDPFTAAIKSFQKRNKSKITGSLSPTERATLVAAAAEHEQEFGWSIVVDPATGIRIGLPAKMVPNAKDAPRGTRWSSAHGEIQVETFRIVENNIKLAALFEQEKNKPDRKLEYSLLRDDNFIVSGIQGLKKFSVRAQLRDGEVRGFTILYDQMMDTIVTPVAVAMAAAFSPFPERIAPFASLGKPVEYGNGLVVTSLGHIVTDRKLTEGCQVIVASGLGDAARIADDKETGLALLRVYGSRQFTPLEIPDGAAKSGDLTLAGIPDPRDQRDRTALSEIKARLADGSAIELRQPMPMAGFSGAAALDSQGRFAGMTLMRNAMVASVEPAAPPLRLVTAQSIRNFLAAHQIVAADSSGNNAKAALVRIICVRK